MKRLTVAAARFLTVIGVSASVARVLSIRRTVRDSVGLSASDRFTNLAGAFQVQSQGRRVATNSLVVIVDDVVTTGATLSEANRVLLKAGIPVFGGVVVAATTRKLSYERLG